jgi:hypothetical protein
LPPPSPSRRSALSRQSASSAWRELLASGSSSAEIEEMIALAGTLADRWQKFQLPVK